MTLSVVHKCLPQDSSWWLWRFLSLIYSHKPWIAMHFSHYANWSINVVLFPFNFYLSCNVVLFDYSVIKLHSYALNDCTEFCTCFCTCPPQPPQPPSYTFFFPNLSPLFVKMIGTFLCVQSLISCSKAVNIHKNTRASCCQKCCFFNSLGVSKSSHHATKNK